MTNCTPKVLVVGDSYIKRLANSVYQAKHPWFTDGLDNFKFTVDLVGFGGATVNRIKEEMWKVDENVKQK